MLKLNPYNYYNTKLNTQPNFKAINLSTEDCIYANSLLQELACENDELKESNIKIALLGIFDKHIKQEAHSKKYLCNDLENHLQNLYLQFFEAIEIFKSIPNSLEHIVAKLNKTKVSEDDTITKYKRTKIYSLDIQSPKMGSPYDSTYAAIKTEKDLPVYVSNPSPEEQEAATENFDRFNSSVKLNDSEHRALKLRSTGKTYQQIAESMQISDTRSKYKIATAIAKIQDQNNVLNPKIKEQAKAFKEYFGLNKSMKEIEKIFIENPYLIEYSIDKMAQNIKGTAKGLNIQEKDYFNSVLTTLSLLSQKPERIINNVKTTAKILGISIDKYVQACLRASTLFSMKPETIESNVNRVIEYFDLDKSQYIKSALRQPQLLYQKPTTLIRNIEDTAKILDVTPQQYAHSALKQPSLFVMKDKTIKANVSKTSKYLEIQEEQFIKIAIIQSQLFLQKPETILKNVQDYCKALNMSKQEFMVIALKCPALLTQRADTNIEHIKEASNLIGMPQKELLEYAVTMPNLFSMNPNSLKQKVDIASIYKTAKGKSTENILKAVRTIKNEDYYDIILKAVIKKQLKIVLENKSLRQNIVDTIAKNDLKTLTITIPQNSMTQDFITYTTNLSNEACGKNIFKFQIQNNDNK